MANQNRQVGLASILGQAEDRDSSFAASAFKDSQQQMNSPRQAKRSCCAVLAPEAVAAPQSHLTAMLGSTGGPGAVFKTPALWVDMVPFAHLHANALWPSPQGLWKNIFYLIGTWSQKKLGIAVLQDKTRLFQCQPALLVQTFFLMSILVSTFWFLSCPWELHQTFFDIKSNFEYSIAIPKGCHFRTTCVKGETKFL